LTSIIERVKCVGPVGQAVKIAFCLLARHSTGCLLSYSLGFAVSE